MRHIHLARPTSRQLRDNAWLLIPVACIVVAAIVALQFLHPATPVPVASKTKAPAVCQDELASKFSCWQSRYRTMTADQSPEAAFADLKQNYQTNPYIKSNCHQLTHVIGRTAAQKYPTLVETYKHGSEFCWSGYYHGAIETIADKIGADAIVSQMNSVCADFLKTKPYSFDHYNCVHGMGHGLMALQDGQIFTALSMCDGYTDDWQAQSCYSGVFMENVMNEINPGSHSDYLRQDEPLYPCTAVQDKYKQQCYLMQTSHALLTVNYDYDKVFSLCSQVAAPYDITCYQSLGRDVSGQSSSDQAKTIDLCMRGPSAVAQDNCFTGAVKDFISYYHSDTQGRALCKAIPDASLASSCSSTAKLYYQSF